ncbi:hypothetical protein R80B4_03263 [Fibrobacteres bacterium R8-0-B4]
MIAFLSINAGTILTGLVLVGIVTAIVINLFRKKKSGCACCCSCCGKKDSCGKPRRLHNITQ